MTYKYTALSVERGQRIDTGAAPGIVEYVKSNASTFDLSTEKLTWLIQDVLCALTPDGRVRGNICFDESFCLILVRHSILDGLGYVIAGLTHEGEEFNFRSSFINVEDDDSYMVLYEISLEIANAMENNYRREEIDEILHCADCQDCTDFPYMCDVHTDKFDHSGE